MAMVAVRVVGGVWYVVALFFVLVRKLPDRDLKPPGANTAELLHQLEHMRRRAVLLEMVLGCVPESVRPHQSDQRVATPPVRLRLYHRPPRAREHGREDAAIVAIGAIQGQIRRAPLRGEAGQVIVHIRRHLLQALHRNV